MTKGTGVQPNRRCRNCGSPGHRRDHCPDAPQTEARPATRPAAELHSAAGLQMRVLTSQERSIVFSGIDLCYLDAIREMDGGRAYAFSLNGFGKNVLRQSLEQAATFLGLKLAWAPGQRGATEIVCELSE